VHKALRGAGQNPVVDKEILFDRQARVVSLEITCPVVDNTMAERQILRPGRRPYWVELDKTQFINRT